METASSKSFDRTNAAVALGVLAVTLTAYIFTMAPTLSLWDCGEFISACYVLGIPHPPGYPLYTVIGRIFSVLAPFSDIAVRVNFLSAFSNAFAAFFGYLVSVRMLRMWFGEDRSAYARFLIYGGSAAGAFFMAFGFTQWSNSIEAEVYGLTMLLFMLVFWLTLRFFERRGTPEADRYMLLAAFLATIGVGVHLTAFMIFVVAGLIFMMRHDTPAKYWFMIGAYVVLELYLVFAMSSRADEVPYYVPVIIVAVFYAFFVFSFDRIPRSLLLIGGGFLVAIAPVYAVIVQAVSAGASGGRTIAPEPPAVLNWIGILGLIALVIYAIINLVRYRQPGKRATEAHRLTMVASLFILAAAAMTIILVSNIRGYVEFMFVSAVLTIILVTLLRNHIRWPILIAVGAVSLVIVGVKPFVIGLVLGVVLISLLGIKLRLASWKVAVAMIVLTVVGYSIHVYLPVRSSRSPVINQSNPSEGLTTTINLLERKQYGSEGMIKRMFVRRG
ncbi:MAG: DUF2723 domain-containing protein, partial [Candidatus Zixiibacteriota bacterium]